jgi:hypothetical protein
MGHIKRNYSGQERNRPVNYVKLEIESYDPSHIYYLDGSGWKGSNFDTSTKDGFYYYFPASTSSHMIINRTYNVKADGRYRVEVFYFSTTYNNKLKLSINNRVIGTKSTTSKDVMMHKLDFGIQTLKAGKIPIKVETSAHTGFITVYLKKIRETYTDTENNGLLTLTKAKVTLGRNKQADTLSLTVFHEDKPWNQGGLLEHGNTTGLVFEYRDVINFYVKDVDGKLRRIFGGYISTAKLSDDKDKIDIDCAGRLKDAELRYLLKQVTIGGAISEITNLTYKSTNLYDAFNYMCGLVELPINVGNLNVIKNEIPAKIGYHIDYTSRKSRDRVSAKYISKTSYRTCIMLRNDYRKNKTQYSVLWDSSWNKVNEKKGNPITSKGVFYIKYGLGGKPSNKKYKVWVPKQYTPKTHKIKKGTNCYKWKKGTAGYNKDTPFRCWIEIQYSIAPGKRSKRYTANIEFTADRTADKIGSINPILAYNTKKEGELDVVNILKQSYPVGTNFYIRRVALKWSSASDQNLYDPKTEKSNYKMLLYGWGFRSGEVINPEVLQTAGQKVADQIYSTQEKLNLNMYLEYAKNRCDDKLMFFREETEANIFELKEGIDGNVLGISNITYAPISNLKNSIIKVYKTSDTKNAYITTKTASSIYRFGEHQDVEVLNDNVGTAYARYLAKTDEDKNTNIGFSYTLIVEGYPNVKVGQYVISTLDNDVLNDLQPIESLEVDYDISKRPMLQTTLGLGELNPTLFRKMTMSQARQKVLNTRRQIFDGGAAETDEVVDLEM